MPKTDRQIIIEVIMTLRVILNELMAQDDLTHQNLGAIHENLCILQNEIEG